MGNNQLTGFICAWILTYLVVVLIGRGVYMGWYRVSRDEVNTFVVRAWSLAVSFAITWLLWGPD